jgi:hypothetical protein
MRHSVFLCRKTCKRTELCYSIGYVVSLKNKNIRRNIMGQQHNKVIKRRRRKAYLERIKAKVREMIAKKK